MYPYIPNTKKKFLIHQRNQKPNPKPKKKNQQKKKNQKIGGGWRDGILQANEMAHLSGSIDADNMKRISRVCPCGCVRLSVVLSACLSVRLCTMSLCLVVAYIEFPCFDMFCLS